MSFVLHQDDLPEDVALGDAIAVDTETMGLNLARDRLCLVQISVGDGTSHLVRFRKEAYGAPRLKAALSDPKRLKIFHFARFDLAALQRYLKIDCRPVYCTRTASLLIRTYTDRHGLKALCRELLGVEISKQQQSSDWGAAALSEEQLRYAAADVLYLHRLREVLDGMLAREGREALAQAAFDFLPTRAALDLAGWENVDIFAH